MLASIRDTGQAGRYDEGGVLIDPWPVDSYAYDAGAYVGGYNLTDRTRHGPQLPSWGPFCCTNRASPDPDSMTVQCVLRDGHRGQHRDRDGLEFDDQDPEYWAVIPESADTHIP